MAARVLQRNMQAPADTLGNAQAHGSGSREDIDRHQADANGRSTIDMGRSTPTGAGHMPGYRTECQHTDLGTSVHEDTITRRARELHVQSELIARAQQEEHEARELLQQHEVQFEQVLFCQEEQVHQHHLQSL